MKIRGLVALVIVSLLSSCTSQDEQIHSEGTPFSASQLGSSLGHNEFTRALEDKQKKADHPSGSYEEHYRLLSKYWNDLSECMNDAGWDGHSVSSPNTPNVSYHMPDFTGQESAYIADYVRCQDETDGFPIEPEPTPQTIEQVYDSQLEFHSCAIKHGYAISEPPSLASYTDAFLAGRINWDPQGELLNSGQMTSSDFLRFHETCPYWW